jgi:hypothetical protein
VAVRASIEFPRAALRRVFFQRCFYLFVVLLGLIGVSPFLEGEHGTFLLAGFNAFVVLAAAAALGRTALSFLVVFCLISAAVGLRFASLEEGRGAAAKLQLIDLLYFSFSTLTTIGFGDIVPATRGAQVAAMFEGVVGTLFLAILIAKLVGVYPPPVREPPPPAGTGT